MDEGAICYAGRRIAGKDRKRFSHVCEREREGARHDAVANGLGLESVPEEVAGPLGHLDDGNQSRKVVVFRYAERLSGRRVPETDSGVFLGQVKGYLGGSRKARPGWTVDDHAEIPRGNLVGEG